MFTFNVFKKKKQNLKSNAYDDEFMTRQIHGQRPALGGVR